MEGLNTRDREVVEMVTSILHDNVTNDGINNDDWDGAEDGLVVWQNEDGDGIMDEFNECFSMEKCLLL